MQGSAHRGFFLTFEGLDGSGKTTQITLLANWLQAQNIAYLLTRQPGGTPAGDRIREFLLDSRVAGLSPRAELAMMFADRAQAIDEVIEPALIAGKLVVCDRFTDSTEAYQGGGRQLGSQLVLDLHRLLCRNLQPDMTLLLLPSISASLERARQRNSKTTSEAGTDENRFEREKDAFFERVHDQYREIARRDPTRVVVVDGDLTVNEVHAGVVKACSDRLRMTAAS